MIRILIIDEKFLNPKDADQYLGGNLSKVKIHKITTYNSLKKLLVEGLQAFDLVVATPSFVEYDFYADWKSILHKFLKDELTPPIIMVSTRPGFLENLKGIDDRLHLVSSPEAASKLIHDLLF